MHALPRAIQREIAERTGHLHEVDGGLSEESVAGTSPPAALIRDLANIAPPSGNVNIPDSNRQLPSVESRLTDPTAIDIFRNDDSTESPANEVPSSVNVSTQSRADESALDEVTFDPTSMMSGQYTDATEPAPELETALLNTQRDELPRRIRMQGKLWLLLMLVPLFLLLAVAMTGLLTRPKHTHSKPDPHPLSPRMREILRCASNYSKRNITERGTPRRWKVATYLADGFGRHFNISNCDNADSDFSVFYSLLVLRDSTNLYNPSWFPENVQQWWGFEYCYWKRVRCDFNREYPYPITHLFLNSAELFGTIPPEIQWIRGLEFLQLCSNAALFGPIPSELGLLTNLTEIQIQSTSISGTIPSALGRLKSLNKFYLYNTKLTGAMPSEICELPHISSLKADCKGSKPGLNCTCCTSCQGKTYPPVTDSQVI